MDLISHPMRLRPNGTMATVVEGSDQANAELIASLALTVRGERPFVPAYGIDDPAFNEFDLSDLQAGVLLFASHIELVESSSAFVDDSTERVVISYE